MSIRNHTLQNLAGALIPILLGIVVVPLYLHAIGVARYGVLSLVWLVVGYFGLFDLGLARATAYHIARLHTAGSAERGQVFMTAAALNVLVGLAGAAVLFAFLPVLLRDAFHIPAPLLGELAGSRFWIAASVPLATLNGVLLGALEGRQRFDLLNLSTGSTAFLLQLVPLAIAFVHGPSLAWLLPSVVLARAVASLGTLGGVLYALPFTAKAVGVSRAHIGQLLRYGGWITVSSLAGNLLVALDRLLIGTSLGVVAVSFYTVPYNLVTRASILPSAVSTSLFPRLSRHEGEDAASLAARGVVTLAAIFTPLVVLGLLALPLFMQLWLGRDFARHATPVALILLAGIWINGLAFVPFSHLQAGNRASRSAWLHVVELPLFLALLWFGLREFGLLGAAIAWTIRAAADAVMSFWLAGMGRALRPLGLGAVAVILAARPGLLSPLWLLEAVILGATLLWARQLVPGLSLKGLVR
jgi:O-antigen/teichoic acid export membrane protein